MITEKQARARLTYWDDRLKASMAGRDSREPAFILFAQWAVRYWTGQVTQLELDADRPYEEAA